MIWTIVLVVFFLEAHFLWQKWDDDDQTTSEKMFGVREDELGLYSDDVDDRLFRQSILEYKTRDCEYCGSRLGDATRCQSCGAPA